MRRSPIALAVLVAVALTVSACGSSSKSSATSGAATNGGSGDSGGAAGGVTAILKGIDPKGSTGPQKLKVDLSVDIKGTPSNAQVAMFTKQPIDLTVDGVVDSAGKSADVNVSVTLAKQPIKAEFRTGGGKSWLQIDGKWYDLPADLLSSTTGQSLPSGVTVSSSDLDIGAMIKAVGDPAKLLDNSSVSSEKVEGVDSDKVSGDVNIAAFAAAAANVSKTTSGGSTTAPSQAEIDKAVAEAEKVVKKAHVDIWVGKSDHTLHRFALTMDTAMDADTKASTGIESATISVDATSVDASAPDVSAPASVGTSTELQTALIGLLGKVMGGAAAG